MRSVFFPSSKPSSPSPSYASSPSSPRHHSFSASMMEENIDYAQSVITRWDVDSSAYTKISSLFVDDRREAKEFIKSVKDLRSAMHFFVNEDSSSEKLVRAQHLMQIAMKRLEKEFYLILSANRNSMDPESVSYRSSTATRSSASDFEDDASEDEIVSSSNEVDSVSDIAMADLKMIADCMISAGYGKECVKIYKLIRKSVIDETLYYLGVEKLTSSQIQKLDWDVVENKIKIWLKAVKIAVKTLFYGERILCDNVFSASEIISVSCFAEISRDVAANLFGFPEHVAKCKKSPEKMFRFLDLYEAVADLWPEIESIFAFESVSVVRLQAITSLVKLGEAVRAILLEFETAIQKDTSKSPVPGGGIHPLTRYVMNYVVFLTDYSGSLSDILVDWPLSMQSPLPESYFMSPISDDHMESAISVSLAWLILVLLCKLDGKAELYKDVSLSYLFLANNLNYVVSKVRSSNLKLLIGDEWLLKHEAKVKQYAGNYVRMGWSKVVSSLPENRTADISPEEAQNCFGKFNSSFEEAYRKQRSWVIPDPNIRDEIRLTVSRTVAPAYRDFYEKHGGSFRRRLGIESVVRFSPDDLGNYLSDLFYGDGVSESTTSHASTARGDRRN